MNTLSERKNSHLTRAIVVGVVLVLLIASGIIFRSNTAVFQHMVHTIQHIHEVSPVYSWIIFGLLQTVVALCGVLPASIGAIVSGMVFGIRDGFILSGVATIIGALGAFYLSRAVFREQIQGLLARRRFLLMLDQMALDQGWKIVCLLRLSPVLPFAITSYALGLTTITVRDYLVGTMASLPALLGYVVMGHLAENEVSNATHGSMSWVHFIMTTLAVLATVLLVWQFGRFGTCYFQAKNKSSEK
ncbi:TVP38/TMEM64 family protein [Gluconobacter thailandicus]|uniref:TVP38/TMEM64 family membrane protein n=1 Tax=Gluconobacter thailandicus TaxID=257438 RepID=A0AAP9JHX1_GLUTH|nr:VTT domain-containing protein [Gluconobacter thailandicus]QEH96632.1 TVP38/TMEM64 family protein [Gluconobacter thailandicus]